MLGRWEHYDNDKALGVRGFGATKAEAFEQAALAMTAALADPARVVPAEKVLIQCQAPSDDELFTQWLAALAREMGERRMLFSRFEVWFDGDRLSAHAWGEPLNAERHRPAVKLRGESQTGTLRVARHGDGWLAQTLLSVGPA
jgi:SHS2 domain-containing protein